jgi:hypothetical protein
MKAAAAHWTTLNVNPMVSWDVGRERKDER